MPVYDGDTIPDSVGRGTLDPELAAWLPSGPTLGADTSIAQGRRDHQQLGVGPWPPIGAVEHLVLDGPHGSLPVGKHVPSRPGTDPRGHWSTSTAAVSPTARSTSSRCPCGSSPSTPGSSPIPSSTASHPSRSSRCSSRRTKFVVGWLAEHATEQGVDPERIALGGDSAGGNMTCVIALRLRDSGGPRLALQVPLFPEAAFPADTPAASENRAGLYLESNGIFEMVRNLVRNSDDVRHPHITPMNAESHAALPPTILLTNGFDPLRDVGHAYARKLAAAGNQLTYVHHPDLIHGFPQSTRSSRAAHNAVLDVAGLIAKALA